jgi:L-malate glycosyltransferase
MKIVILSDGASIHTIKWVNALLDKGHEIAVFSLKEIPKENYHKSHLLHLHSLALDSSIFKSGEGAIGKLTYLKALPTIQKLINTFQPDILHAHYASSYGLLGALSKFHPFVLSVWGSDVFEFPKRNFIFNKILRFNFSKADAILSTSIMMAKEAELYTNKHVKVTPFGVDVNVFKKNEEDTLIEKEFIIGTIKTLEHKYGIDILLKAFELFLTKNPTISAKLIIAGGGSESDYYIQMAKSMSIKDKVLFLGKISHQEVPKYLNKFDVFVALSRKESESFGVAIVEAMACEVPVIVSNIGGLPEVVDHEKTGLVVAPENEHEAALAIEKIILNEALAKSFGENGRQKVMKLYDWSKNVDLMCEIYQEVLLQR